MVTERTKKAGLAKAAGTATGKGAKQAGNTPPLAGQTFSKQDKDRLVIWGVVWIALIMPFLLLCLIAPQFAGALGKGLASVLNNCIGMASWTMPMLAFLAALWCFECDSGPRRIKIKVVTPLLLFFSVFFAARCSQGGAIGSFIDGIVVGVIGKFGAWVLASLGFLSVFVFTWNLTTEETIEGCKALSQFSGSSLIEMSRRAASGLSKFWSWIISLSKSCVELLVGAKEKFSEHHQEDDENDNSENTNIEPAEPTELEQKAVFYDESGIISNASEGPHKIESLTSRGFFEDEDQNREREPEEANQSPRFAEQKFVSNNQEKPEQVNQSELLNEIHRRNASGEMASIRNREYEAARRAERSGEGAPSANAGARYGIPVRSNAEPLRLASREKEQIGWKRDEGAFASRPIAAEDKETLRRPEKTEIRSAVPAKHEPATAKEGLALSRRLAERPSHNSGSGVARGSSSFSSRSRLGENAKNEEKDVPLRPVRSSSSGGYRAARPVGTSLQRGAASVSKPNLIDSNETVEVASLKRAAESKLSSSSKVDSGHVPDELDKKVEALKFSERLDSDLNLAASASATLERPEEEAIAASAAVAEKDSAASSPKMSDLTPEQRRSALGIIRRSAGGARPQSARPKAEEAAENDSATVAEKDSAASSPKMSDLTPEQRRNALGIIRRSAGGARPQSARPKVEEAAENASATVVEKDSADSSPKMSDLTPEQRRSALGIIRRPADGARPQASQQSKTEATENASAISEDESVSAASLKKLNALSPEERRRALMMGEERRPSALPVDPEELESFSTLSPSQINALPPEERRRALGIRNASSSPINRDRNSLSGFKALRGAEGNNVACDPKAALNALSSRRPGAATAGMAAREAKAADRVEASKKPASFTRSATPSLMRSTTSRSTSVSRTASTKQPQAETPEMSKEDKLAAWRASTLRARASFKRQSEGKARSRQEKANREVSDDMPFSNDLMNNQGPALRPPVSQNQALSSTAALASKRTARQQLGIIPRARKNGSTSDSRHAAMPTAPKADGSDADDVDFRKKNSENELNLQIESTGVHSAIGSPEMLSRLVSDGPPKVGVRPQLGEFSDASLNRQVKARLSQFHSAVGELQGVTWSEGGDLDSLLNPSKHSAAALTAVKKDGDKAESIVLEPTFATPETSSQLQAQAPVAAKEETALPAVPVESTKLQAAELIEPAKIEEPQSVSVEAEEEEDLPFPKPRSSSNYKAVGSPKLVEPIQSAKNVIAPQKTANFASRAEVASYVSSEKFSPLAEFEEAKLVDEQLKRQNAAQLEAVDEGVKIEPAAAEVHKVEQLSTDEDVAIAAPLARAKSTVEVEIPHELLDAELVEDDAAENVGAENSEVSEVVSAVSATAETAVAEQNTAKRFDLGLDGDSIDFDNIMPRDRDRFINLRPINLTGSSVYRNPIRPSFFAVATKVAPIAAQPAPAVQAAPIATQPVPAVQAAPIAAQPAPAVQAAPVAAQPVPAVQVVPVAVQPAPAVQAAPVAAQPAPAVQAAPVAAQPVPAVQAAPVAAQPSPAVQAAPVAAQPAPAVQVAPVAAQPASAVQAAPVATQPAPAVQAAPVVVQPAPTVQAAPVAQARRSPAFGFDRSERRVIGSSTPVSSSAASMARPAAIYPSSIAPVSGVRVVGQQPNSAASAPLAMPRKSNSGTLQAVEHYMLPSLSLLEEVPPQSRHEFVDKSELLIRTLASFKVEATVRNVIQGPAVTRYELEPAIGVRVNKFINLTNDIALALAATTVRIEAPVPGKSVVGVEVPNGFTELVALKEVLSSDNFRNGKGLCVGLGKDISGTARVTDLSKMPHLLVAGTTGSGKSVCINTLILSLLYRFTPRNLQLLMIDPKQVELSIYEGLPHLICLTGEEPGKIIVDPKMASSALHQMVNLMEERYTMFSKNRVRNIGEYNVKHPEAPLPWVVVIIDELADLMMVASKDVEKSICRLAQKARAAGIHMVVATQRPSTDVITGLLKVNIPSRIAFAVSSGVDSRVILDDGGAEHLLGKGDMLFKPVDANNGARIQGAFVKNEEIQRVVDFWNRQDVPSNRIQLNIQEDMAEEKADKGGGNDANDDDPLLEEALDAILRTRQASASMLQTELRVGYARARRLINLLEKRGYVGPAEGSKARKILYTGAMD